MNIYRRHVQGAFVRSGASVVMWLSCWLAYQVGIIRISHFTGVSFSVIYLILFNFPMLWILKRIQNRTLFGYFSLLINILEIIGYTSILYFLGGIEATYLLPIYAAIVVYVGVVASRRFPFIIAGVCAICFNMMVILGYYGIIPTYQVRPSSQYSLQDQIMIMLVNMSLLFVIAFISSYSANLLKMNRDRLRRQNEELRIAVQRASESDRMKSEFLANMSHELRTPLNAVIGFSELLENPHAGVLNEKQKEYVKDINDSGKHLLFIINDILDLSKIEAGKVHMETKDVHLHVLLSNSLSMFKEKALKHRIQLTTDLEHCPQTIKADELRLKQIVFNLLSNAVKFTQDGGTVVLSARCLTRMDQRWRTDNGEIASLPAPAGLQIMKQERVVDIAVTDNGIGLKKEDMERIFKPFEQVDGSSSRRYQGTGLGLSLTKRFAELHGGYIHVESEGENRGSTFHCVIPA